MEKHYVLYKTGAIEKRICVSLDLEIMKEGYKMIQKSFPNWKLEIRIEYIDS